MGKGKSSGGGSSRPSGSSSSRGGVSQSRLSQRSGTSNSFGGYTKVNNGGGNFSMKPTSKGK
jgi:hypothetical protein